MTEYVVALTPGPRARDAVTELKSRLRTAVGDQQYLDDEPHVTLYVGDLAVDSAEDLAVPRPDDPTFEISGWEVFRDDDVTGNHTLVCKILSAGLGKYQQRVAGQMADHRRRTMIDRYRDAYDDFDPQRRENLSTYGFPFVGDGWKPHLTIASIDPDDFDEAWSVLEGDAPVGTYEFDAVTVYELVDGDLRERVRRSV
ncbi:2'-5' RNA ligase family protein [Halobaculum sp. P14]|uniref:2'-5' RNA ligase family protein n=1 Tax=Halobaculum sp. P14 TaxID=3421638 RepID=UPI003EB74B1D